MSQSTATVFWQRRGAVFTDNRYSRAHRWLFDGGLEIQASSSPSVVPEPMSDPRAVDPEEAFVASLSSCHMLWFLSIAAKRGYTVEEYRDDARGELGKNGAGRTAVTVVTLRPAATFFGQPRPTREDILSMHDEAHERCFIANSVTTVIRCEPVFVDEDS